MSVTRIYTAQCQLQVTDPDPATAQADVEKAVAQINTALAGSNVAFQIESENGQIVFQEQ